MAVLMTAQIPGATQAMADGMEPLLNESAARRVSSFTPTARCLTAGASSMKTFRLAGLDRRGRLTSAPIRIVSAEYGRRQLRSHRCVV